MEKQLPQNVEAEHQLIGKILEGDSQALAESAFLPASAFYREAYRLVWKCKDVIQARGEEVNLFTMLDELTAREEIGEGRTFESFSELTALTNQTSPLVTAKSLAKSIHKAAAARRIIEDIGIVAGAAYTGDAFAAHALLRSACDDSEEELNAGGDDSPLRPLSLAEMLAQPAPELLVDRLLMEHGVSMIAGDGGSGKSLLLADLCVHIALGREWNGHKVKQGAVLVVAGEGGQGFAWRVKAWLEHYGMSLDDLTNFYIIPHAVQVLDDAQRARVVAYAKALPEPIALVAIETLSQTAGGADQNDNSEMAAYVRSCREIATALEAHVTFTHHALKTGNGYRGASSLKDDSDTTILVSRDGDVSTAHCEKQRDGWEYFPDFTFTGTYVSPEGAKGLSYGVFEYTGLKAHTERPERVKPIPDARRYALEAIAQQPGITRAQVKDYCTGYKVSRTAAYRAINEMIDAGWISEEMDGLAILPTCPNLSQFVPTGQAGLSLVRPILSHTPLGVGQVGQTGQSGHNTDAS